ncbi:MAG: hypothetical protein H7A43_07010 [Verrucomicrobia bacterium]|nr:hypothetical protein [Verrucomicrobiota bacterium]
MKFRIHTILLAVMIGPLLSHAQPFAELEPPTSQSGYLARLLINEAPFPGEKGYVSEENTRATMLQILWVLHGRIHYIPDGYRQEHIASIKTSDIFDIITAGGEKGQCDGFYRDAKGNLAAVPRVEERIQYLSNIANSGGKPGKFAGLLNYGQGLAKAYLKGGIQEADRFASLHRVGSTPVTGRAYSWMTDRDCYSPGGNFVKIPNNLDGSLGGNRFFTLKDL